MDRSEKRAFVETLSKILSATKMVVVTRNDGLTVSDVTQLRRDIREAGAVYKVAKNRLALRAIEGTPFEGISEWLSGPTAISWSDEPVGVAKALSEFSKKNDKLVILGGSLGEQKLDVNSIKALASLPSLDELRAKIVGMINTPATRIAGVTQAPAGQLARVIGAYAREGKAAA